MPTPDNEKPKAKGHAIRKPVPRGNHGEWSPAPVRPDPVELITSQSGTRLHFPVPIRHWRIAAVPVCVLPGRSESSGPGPGDDSLDQTARSDLRRRPPVEFDVYGSPVRALVFDLNDLDETLPGPREWDVKRLAASFVIPAQLNEFDSDDERDLPRRVVAEYLGRRTSSPECATRRLKGEPLRMGAD